VTFVITVALGIIVVPIGLYFADRGQFAAAQSTAAASPSPTPSANPSASPTPTP
jgi:hypothetical protein